MNTTLLHRVIFPLILSGIMSGSMTYMVSSFYCTPQVDNLLPIWVQAWAAAFSVIFILSSLLHLFTAYLIRYNRGK